MSYIFQQRPVIDTDIDTIVKCWSFEQNVVRAFSNQLEHLVTNVSPLLLPYRCKYIFKQQFFSEPKRTCDLFHPIHKHYMTFCMKVISRLQAGRHQPVKR